MKHHPVHLAVTLTFLAAACGTGNPGPSSELRPISVRIDGPTDVTPPAEVQFTALQTWSDGSSRDVTAAAQWTSTNPSVLTISAGFAIAVTAGQVGLTARFQQHTSNVKNVRVLPVHPEWDGTYTLTVGGGACRAGPTPLPPELRQRTYTATVQQRGLSLSGEVSNVGAFGGQILNPEARFSLYRGGVFARPRQRAAATELLPQVTRVAARDDYRRAAYSVPPPSFTEVLPDGNVLTIDGDAVTTMSPSGFAGTLNGSFALYGPSRSYLLAACSSPSHTFTLVRR